MRREYGSNLFDLIDRPMNALTMTEIYSATIDALSKHEPRITVNKVAVQAAEAGSLTLSLSATDNETGDLINLSDLKVTA